MLFCQVFSPAFYSFYIVAGVSDMIDGIVARKTGTASEFGSKLDTVADIVFVAVCLIKMLPVIDVPSWIFFGSSSLQSLRGQISQQDISGKESSYRCIPLSTR